MICIELSNATEQDYQMMKGSLQKIDVERSITDEFGKTYKLPRSQYHFATDDISYSGEIVLNALINTTMDLNLDAKIIVTSNEGSAWYGLQCI